MVFILHFYFTNWTSSFCRFLERSQITSCLYGYVYSEYTPGELIDLINKRLTDWLTDWQTDKTNRWTDRHKERKADRNRWTETGWLSERRTIIWTDCLIILLGKPSILFKAPSSSSTYVGQSAVFHCVVVGDPDPVVHWKNSSNSIIISGGRFEVFSNGTLEINNLLKTDDESLYTCEAVNSYGTTAASTTLRVNGMWFSLWKEQCFV